MKRLRISAAVIVVSILWFLPTGLMAQSFGQDSGAQSGECYFQASEDTYLKIYDLDKDGVERGTVWEGFLPAGNTKAFNAPYGAVGYATKQAPDDPWNEDQADCVDGESIDIP